MFKTIKNALKNQDIRKKIYFTLFILIIYRLGSFVTIPGINAKALSQSSLTNVLDMFSGGGLSNYSVFAMGVSPFITAQIIVQLLQTDVIPKFVEWAKQGEVGRQKLNNVTKWLTIALAFVQSIGITAGFNYLSKRDLVMDPSIKTYVTIGVILTAGAMATMWLGDMITSLGIGQGVSIIIFAGIISRLPGAIYSLIQSEQIWLIVGLLALVLVVVVFVTWFQQADRRLPIQYTKRASVTSDMSYLPLKVNVSGVIPVIFASSISASGQALLMIFHSKSWYSTVQPYFDMQTPVGMMLYTILIIAFTFLYAFVQVNPEKLAENLQKQGAYIPNVRPGQQTQKYVGGLLVRLSVVGSLFLGLISLMPLIASQYFGLDSSLGLGGTSLLIVVGVAIQLIDQLNGLVLKKEYQGLME